GRCGASSFISMSITEALRRSVTSVVCKATLSLPWPMAERKRAGALQGVNAYDFTQEGRRSSRSFGARCGGRPGGCGGGNRYIRFSAAGCAAFGNDAHIHRVMGGRRCGHAGGGALLR